MLSDLKKKIPVVNYNNNNLLLLNDGNLHSSKCEKYDKNRQNILNVQILWSAGKNTVMLSDM